MSRNSVPKSSNKPLVPSEAKKQHNMKGKHVTFSKPDDSTDTNVLAEPIYHSTAAIGHHLKQFQTLEFDAEGTVLKTLEKSDMARINFAEKVADAVNVSKRQTKYSGLVSVDVPVEATIAQELEDRMSRLRPDGKKLWQKPSKASDVAPPSIMSMYSPALIVEEPIMDVPTSNALNILKPQPCSPDVAFDLYRHMHCWDS